MNHTHAMTSAPEQQSPFQDWERLAAALSAAADVAMGQATPLGVSPDDAAEPFWEARDALEERILQTPPDSTAAAVVKLRRVAALLHGCGARFDGADEACLRQVIDWLEASPVVADPWDVARLALEAAEKAGDGQAAIATRRALFATPAPHGVALGLKLALYGLAGDIGADIRTPAVADRIEAEGDDAERELLSCYRDALRLGGAEPCLVAELAGQVARLVRSPAVDDEATARAMEFIEGKAARLQAVSRMGAALQLQFAISLPEKIHRGATPEYRELKQDVCERLIRSALNYLAPTPRADVHAYLVGDVGST